MPRPPALASGLPALDELLEPKQKRALASFAVRDLGALLRFRPRRYVTPAPLRSLHEVADGEEMTAFVQVQSVRDRPMRRRSGFLLEAVVRDETDQLTLTFFLPKEYMVRWHRERLIPGITIRVRGTVRIREGTPQLTHPEYEQVEDTPEARERAARPGPVYPLKKNIKQQTMRDATRIGVEHAAMAPPIVPEQIRRRRSLPTLAEAARRLHEPHTLADADSARRAFAAEEALILQVIFAQRRAQDALTPAPALTADGPLQALLDERLPFTLTAGQRDVGAQTAERIGLGHPSSVLLQGDVGSGKTLVALRAMLRAVDSGHQAALLAPTEVLAEQHHRTIMSLLGDLAQAGHLDAHEHATRVRLLTGSQRTGDKRQTLLDVTSGEAGLVIGTHALLTDAVEFASLGLVVIDEQHRFGVDHRRRLRAKGPQGTSPHVIVMTATPIPRTAALTAVGDLDVLTLRDRPGHRAGTTSFAVHESQGVWMQRMWARTREEIDAGRQVFVVCPHIEESEPEEPKDGSTPAPPPRAVLETAAQLQAMAQFSDVRIGVLHSRLTTEEKQHTMAAMAAGTLDLLVATTMIEVGVDVPNASVMIVLDAERFGVSQLHQLRGRVGRAEHPGIAFFQTRTHDADAMQRLTAIAGTEDGFELAQLDLMHRGAGDLIGDEQSGLARTLRYLDVVTDLDLIEHAHEDAVDLIAEDPELQNHPMLAAAVEERLLAVEHAQVERS
ncbi:ATP-dependent DNA helicase RecG [Brachybacterium timonense]|uniref:ATP-dependent DNA helicase RecG n=1 Tax=Brachybacterium timonense TaxID=2050896 RepID=UPI000D0B13F5|nr:ATP-dependent DNA helicase RecG [Brachybacterium timonense]